MTVILFVLSLFTTLGGLVFIYALVKDMFYDIKPNPKAKEAHKFKFLMWDAPFIAVWCASVLNFILLMCGVHADKVLVLSAIHAGIYVWYFIQMYKRYTFSKGVIFKNSKD